MKKITEKTLRECVGRLAGTDDGQIFLAALKQDCNWDTTIISDNPVITQTNAAKRGVYGGVRKLINKKDIKVIEHDIEIVKEVHNDK